MIQGPATGFERSIVDIEGLAVFKYFNFDDTNLSFLLHGFVLSKPLSQLLLALPIYRFSKSGQVHRQVDVM